MKRVYKVFFCALITSTILSCERKQDEGGQSNETLFSAVVENEETKVILQDNGAKVCFAPGDAIAILQGKVSGRFESTLQQAATRSEFSGTTTFSGDGTPFWAVYPYSEDCKLSDAGVMVTIPDKQVASEETIDASAFYMIAKSNTHQLSFRNVCGGIKFSVTTDDITKVVFSGKKNEILAGTVYVNLDQNGIPVVSSVVTPCMSIEISAPEGGAFKKGVWYYCSTLPVQLTGGFSLHFCKDTEGGYSSAKGTYQQDSPVSITRSVWGRIAEADDSAEYHSRANNETILYKTVDGTPEAFYYYVGNIDYSGFNIYYSSDLSKDPETVLLDNGYYYARVKSPTEMRFGLAGKDSNLKELVLPKYIKYYGDYGCSYCESLEKVTIDEERTWLWKNEFSYCKNLKTVVMPRKLMAIYANAFMYCSSLPDIIIPENVYKIEADAFKYCESLTRVDISNLTSWCNISFGNEYSNPLYYAGNLYLDGQLKTELRYPEDVPSAKDYSFAGVNLSYLYISPAAKSLGQVFVNSFIKKLELGSPEVFENFTIRKNCEEIILQKGVTETIPNEMFEGCSKLKGISIPEGVTSIGDRAFEWCTHLESISIPSTVKSIGEKAFVKCTELKEVTIAEGVTSVGDYAFKDCTNLESITIPSSVTTVGKDAFSDCTNLKRIVCGSQVALAEIPTNSIVELIIPNGVPISIPDFFCEGRKSLERLTLGNGVTRIGSGAFKDTGLESIVIPSSVKEVGSLDAPFRNAPLKKVEIASSSFWIDFTKFSETLEEVILRDKPLTSLEKRSFYMCEKLRSIELPSALVSIEEEVFMGCESLESVVIPSGVTLISPRTFQGCKGLKSISIPAGVTIIAERLFKDCHSLSSITIPQGVTTIGQNAFENAYSLASVSIPSSVTGIYYNAFLSCQGLNRVDIPTLSDWFKIGFSNEYSNPLYYAHDLYVDGKYLDKLIIPDDVSAVKNYSFAGCGFSKIVIREGVTKIGDYSFAHSPKVSEVVISSGVTSIEKGVFSGCSRLERVSLPSTLISIGAEAFDSCTSLEGVDFPSSLTTIGEKAFNNCSAITSLYIPSNVTALINAFYCTGVKKLEIASSAAIAYSKDYSIGCPNVEEIFFMDELHCAIPPIFSSFEYLREVTISAGVTCVGQAAFLYNSRLNRVVILGKDLEGRSEMFYPSNDQLKIFVPADCVEKYKNADYWHDYADKIFPIE